MWICGSMRGPKSRHIFHCSPYHIGVSCFELTIQQRTVQHSQQIYITIQKFALSKSNAMMSFNEISEEHISGTLVNTVKASGFQNMKKNNHSPNVCLLPSMIRSDNFCIASNSRRMRRTRWTWFILSAPFHTCHVTALFCHSITIQSLVNHYKYFVHIWNSRNNQLRAEAKNCHNRWSEALSEKNPLHVCFWAVFMRSGSELVFII